MTNAYSAPRVASDVTGPGGRRGVHCHACARTLWRDTLEKARQAFRSHCDGPMHVRNVRRLAGKRFD